MEGAGITTNKNYSDKDKPTDILQATGQSFVALCVISYMDLSALTALFQAFKQARNHFFFELVQVRRFLLSYHNRMQRDMYYPLYEENAFKQLELKIQLKLAEQHFIFFKQAQLRYQTLFRSLQTRFSAQVKQNVGLCILEPDIPLPKLKRETVGMYCHSPFQNFLVFKKYPSVGNQWGFEPFEGLIGYFEQHQSQYLLQMLSIIKQKNTRPQQLSKLHECRFTPFEITYNSLQSIMIGNYELHNFIVTLFAIADNYINVTTTVLNSINDKYYLFMEFLLRYSIYRNFILNIQEQLLAVFELYGSLYEEIIHTNGVPPFNFWRPALTKWCLKMKQYHDQLNNTYLHMLTKLRINHLLNSKYISFKVRNNLLMNQFQFVHYPFDQAFHYFSQEPQLYESLLGDYTEYMVDISIDEQIVHWCGHSQHSLDRPYLQFEHQLLTYNKQYFNYIKQSTGYSPTESLFIFQLQLEFLECKGIKPRTLRLIVEETNALQFATSQAQLIYDFSLVDNQLKYFNEKAHIMEKMEGKKVYLYKISPDMTPEEILMKSVSTVDSEGRSLLDLQSEYYSEEEEGILHKQQSTQSKIIHKSSRKKLQGSNVHKESQNQHEILEFMEIEEAQDLKEDNGVKEMGIPTMDEQFITWK